MTALKQFLTINTRRDQNVRTGDDENICILEHLRNLVKSTLLSDHLKVGTLLKSAFSEFHTLTRHSQSNVALARDAPSF